MLTGGCLEFGAGGLPFAPFTSVLGGLVGGLGAAGVAGMLPGGTGALARLLAELGGPAAAQDAGQARAPLAGQMLFVFGRRPYS